MSRFHPRACPAGDRRQRALTHPLPLRWERGELVRCLTRLRGSASGLLAGAFLATTISSCAPAASPAAEGLPASSPNREQRTLVISIWGEPASLASVPVRDTGHSLRGATRLFNAELDIQDTGERARPYLAEALPQLNTGSWQVFPDGRMETRYRLKPNLTWHDGTPLSAEDFAFAWQVYGNPEFGASSLSIRQMEDVLAPDQRTVTIRWRRSYPSADALFETFQPLPRHILELYQRTGDLDGLANNAYWTVEYVGLGPYRLVRWEPSVSMEGVAFDGHALGRPKIDRLIAKVITDENAILANVLAGEVQYGSTGLRFEHSKVLKREWAPTQRGVVVLIPIQPRFIQFQMRPEVVQPRELLDVRMRQAFAHAIDKRTLEEGLFDGEPAGTDTFLHRGVPHYADIDRAVVKYPHDLRRTEQLMAEVGYTKGPDGRFASETGERLVTDFWGDVGPQFEQDHAAVSAGWRQAGFETRATLVPPAQLRDGQYRSSFKGAYFTASGTATEPSLALLASTSIPTSANRWFGSNRGGWSSPEFHRLWDALNTTLDRSERNRRAVEIERLISVELPLIMVFHSFQVVAHTAALKGPDTRGQRDLIIWNIHEWELG